MTLEISDIVESNINEFVLDEKLLSLDEVTIISKKQRKKLGTISYVNFVVDDVRADNNQNNDNQEFAKKPKMTACSALIF